LGGFPVGVDGPPHPLAEDRITPFGSPDLRHRL